MKGGGGEKKRGKEKERELACTWFQVPWRLRRLERKLKVDLHCISTGMSHSEWGDNGEGENKKGACVNQAKTTDQ